MTRTKLACALLLATVAIPAAASAAPADPSIASFEAAQQAAWNAHDAATYAAAFADDADIVTSAGWHWRGRTEAASNLADGFRLIYAKARLDVGDISVRPLSADLVAVTLNWTLTGARTLQGDAPAGTQSGVQTQVLQRGPDGWHIVVQQDTARATAPVATDTPVPQTAPAAVPAPAAFPTTPPPVRKCIVGRADGKCLIYGKPRPASQ